MAKSVAKITLGIDAAKVELVICNWTQQETTTLPNQRTEIRAFLKSFHGPLRIAIEPTSHYHMILVEEALAQGHEVYLVNARQLAHYREAVDVRNKTDSQDAWLLARFLEREADLLRPFQPRDPRAQRIWALILRRATVVQSRQQLQQSFAEVNLSIQAVLTQFQNLLKRIDRHITQLIREMGWWPDYLRCLSIPGVGPVNAAALVTAYHRGAFSGSNAFVAFMGLDIRVRESGQYKGKSKLSKRGEPELRRLLFCAGKGACSYQRFADYRQRMLDNGRCKIAARVALSRKLARIAFALMQKEETFIKQEKTHCMAP